MLFDAAAGLYLTRTRAYNPRTGRFIQRDILDEDEKDGYQGFPFGKNAIGTNLYAFAGNNPITRVDPSGEAWVAYQAMVKYRITFYRTVSWWTPVWWLRWNKGKLQWYIAGWKRNWRTSTETSTYTRMETRYRWVPQKRSLNLLGGLRAIRLLGGGRTPTHRIGPKFDARVWSGFDTSGNAPYRGNSPSWQSQIRDQANNWWNDAGRRAPSNHCVNAVASGVSIALPPASVVNFWNNTADWQNDHINGLQWSIRGAGTVAGLFDKRAAVALAINDFSQCTGFTH